MGTPGKFLKTRIFAGTSLRKFSWLVSIDFNATITSPGLLGRTMYFLLLWLAGRALGKTLQGGNGRDLKAMSLTTLNWVKKIERSMAAVVGR